MPATEQTWRDSKFMHMIFGLTSLAMLLGTIWMLWDDHEREWKEYQREFRKVMVWSTDARVTELETAEFRKKEVELKDELAKAEKAVPAAELISEFTAAMIAQDDGNQAEADRINADFKQLADAPSAENQRTLFDRLDRAITTARNQETKANSAVKFKRADLDVAKSDYDIGVRDNRPANEQDKLQDHVYAIATEVEKLTIVAQGLMTHRKNLEEINKKIIKPVTDAKKDLDDHLAGINRLQKARVEEESNWGERVLELPIIDAFGRPLKINQIWLPQLTINYNFRDVARFDRCTTCHQGMDITAPGSAIDPAYPHERLVTFQLATPAEAPVPAAADKPEAVTIESLYGMRLAGEALKPNEVAIDAVWPERAAATAKQLLSGAEPLVSVTNPPGTLPDSPATVWQEHGGLRAGDVIVQVNDVKIYDHIGAQQTLVENITYGQPLTLTVRRGISHPYSSHPRLDLFVGSTSPHTMQDFGCTICHQGQGSATSFQWASHTPNTEEQQQAWASEHGWEFNHHWIYPMYPERFIESTCLKCHHEVTELEPSQKFEEPPAPKVTAGYNIVRQYGCFGCHEINGFDGPNRRVGPDLRAEPNYTAAAQQLLTDAGLNDEEKLLAKHVIADPSDNAERLRLAQMIKTDQQHRAAGEEARLSADAYRLLSVLGAEDEAPGKLRKVGPSLRHVASKVDFAFIYDWVREPKHFRTTTRMPQFFGLHEHLEPQQWPDKEGNDVWKESEGFKESERFEPVEIRGITQYLLNHSQPFTYLDKPAEVTEEASAERGKQLFEIRGCLACHKHPDFPASASTQGPDLGQLGAKLMSPDAHRWLYTWLRDPTTYHTRTVMPNVFLTPIKHEVEGKTTVTDPAADIAAYLVGAPADGAKAWQPDPAKELVEADLDDLVRRHLVKVFTEVQTEEYLKSGIPQDIVGELKGDEVALAGPFTAENATAKKLEYIGRRSISKYGCTGCHDVPGYETAKPIGTGLADWGRKEPDKLAFEQINSYLEFIEHHAGGEHGGAGHGSGVAAGKTSGDEVAPPNTTAQEEALTEFDPDGIFVHALEHHHREGFLWQKLRAPRSFDYRKAENKDYNDRLRMPKFNLTPEQLEEVMTFVLGLVADPPAARYVFKPDPRQKAIADGRQILEKFNCGGCHALEMAKWEIEYDPKEFAAPPESPDYAFLTPYLTPKALADSSKVNRSGHGSAELYGLPQVDAEGNLVQDEDDNGNPLYYFTLWQNQAINGKVWTHSSQPAVAKSQLLEGRAPVGGFLARLIYPTVLANEKASNPNAKDSDAWGWVPPPLVGEGRKVQSKWLHDFLLDPYPIRPAVVLRMPRFNMSSDEASKLVDYFSAVDGAEYPYQFDPRTRTTYLAEQDAQHPNRLSDALKIVTNGSYCVKCHLVGDFTPSGAVSAMAPNLDRVYERLRPEFVRNWVANPQRTLPYTGMPINFPLDKPAAQDLYKGNSEQQLQAVVDLLLNYDAYMKGQVSIKPMVKELTPEEKAAADKAAAAGGQ